MGFGMKVGELISKLQELNPGAEVWIDDFHLFQPIGWSQVWEEDTDDGPYKGDLVLQLAG